MQITDLVINDSVAQKPFGSFEPFITGDDRDAWRFYSGVLSALEHVRGVSVIREADHHGSGYASYVSAFLYPRDGSTRKDFPTHIETVTGLRIAHSADIGAPKDLSPLLEGPIDLLVCELAHFAPDQLFAFLQGRPIKRLLLTHLLAECLAQHEQILKLAAEVLPGVRVEVAHDGGRLELD